MSGALQNKSGHNHMKVLPGILSEKIHVGLFRFCPAFKRVHVHKSNHHFRLGKDALTQLLIRKFSKFHLLVEALLFALDPVQPNQISLLPSQRANALPSRQITLPRSIYRLHWGKKIRENTIYGYKLRWIHFWQYWPGPCLKFFCWLSKLSQPFLSGHTGWFF